MDPVQLMRTGNTVETAGTFAGGIAHMMYGLQAQKAAEYQAEQLRINATQEQAASQRDAYAEELKGKLIASRALAVAAASGGGASDPTVVSIIARDAATAAYMRSLALYQGDDRARLMNMQADAKEFEGESQAYTSAIEGSLQLVKGASNAMAGEARATSLYQRFAGDGPKVG